MTTTENRRTVRLTTAVVRSSGRAKEVVVELVGASIVMRLKGERKRFRLSVAVAYALAVQSWVEAEKARRKAERKRRKSA